MLEEINAIEQDVENDQPTAKEIEDAEIAAAFSASFDTDARADEAPATEQSTDEVAEETQIADDEVPADAETEAPPEVKAGVSEEQLTAMLAKMPKIEELETMTTAEIRKVHGKIGEINRALQELQKNGTSKQPGIKLTGANFKRLHEEYPDLAELLAEDLNESGAREQTAETEAAPQQSPLQSNENFDERVAEVKQELYKNMQTSLLLMQHKDYTQVFGSDEFKVWAQTLPADDQSKLEESWDAMYLGEKFTEFKQWRTHKQTGAQERKSRLDRAIVPTGTQAAIKPQAQSLQDGFNAAFKT